MATYFMFSKYTTQAVREITAERTQQAVGIIEKFNGQIVAMYTLLGQYDLVIILNLPGNVEAIEVSVMLNRLTGISFTTSPAINAEKMDSLLNTKKEVPGQKSLDT